MGKELPAETYVRLLFAKHYGERGVELRKIPESTVEGQKTADFEVLFHGVRRAVLEVKTIESTPRTPERGWKPEPYGGMSRTDKSPARIGRLIYSGAEQLGQYPLAPKILVFVNEEHGMWLSSLRDAFNGSVLFGDDTMGYIENRSAWKVARGDIAESKFSIDLYVWIDRIYEGGRHALVMTDPPHEEFRDDTPVFQVTNETGHQLAQEVFGLPELPPHEVREVPSMFEQFFEGLKAAKSKDER